MMIAKVNRIMIINQKGLPITCQTSTGREKRYGSTHSLTLALKQGGWSTPCPSHFTHRKDAQYPLIN
jgi:hypothetical protein